MNNLNKEEKNQQIYKIVKRVIDEWDPHGLLALDCPDDEYDPEIKKIVSIIDAVENAEDLARKIDKIFKDAFCGHYSKPDECSLMSEKIYKLLY